ncbi:MAG TPA: hypothetical protein VI864_01630 [Candidatus Bathyarchaeia archaeon]|nr:hypothetical protein [Candidatus Bathyarchaeia archaeon]
MHDKYDIAIRRIIKGDINACFQTGDKDFDRVNASGTLKEYWKSDTQASGAFYVFLLMEKHSNTAIGILRIKNEFHGVNSSVPSIQGQPAIYFSRVGIIVPKQDLHLSRILLEYLCYVTKLEMKQYGLRAVWVYWRCKNDPKIVKYYSFPGAKIVEEYPGPWGPSLVMAMKISCV